jgi:DNA-binding NtrC family response regulator
MAKNEITALDRILVGKSHAIRSIRKIVEKLRQARNVLIIGERGVGKTAVAQTLHFTASPTGTVRILSPFTIDEREIGNLGDNVRSGTVVIREIEEFSFLQQALFMKFIEDQRGNKSIRIIVTAKEGLPDLKAKEKLSSETAKLLNVFEMIEVPPLNERPEDIPPLVEHFVKLTCNTLGITLKALDINTLDLLSKRAWPENVRELRAVVEHAVLSAQGETVELPASILDEQSQLDVIMKNISERRKFAFDEAWNNLERSLIERVLGATDYNQTKSARVLGISGANFRYRLRKYRIRRKRQ